MEMEQTFDSIHDAMRLREKVRLKLFHLERNAQCDLGTVAVVSHEAARKGNEDSAAHVI